MYSADGLLEEKGDELFLSAFLFSLKKVAEDDELLAWIASTEYVGCGLQFLDGSEINTFDVKFQYGEITSILYGASISDVIIFIF